MSLTVCSLRGNGGSGSSRFSKARWVPAGFSQSSHVWCNATFRGNSSPLNSSSRLDFSLQKEIEYERSVSLLGPRFPVYVLLSFLTFSK